MSITLTDDVVSQLKARAIRVFITSGTNPRFPETPDGFERFTNHFGPGFMPLGAYSYSHSFTRFISKIGRYCSIGENLKIIRNTHPMDRLSSSPVFYSPRKFREWGGKMTPDVKLSEFEPASEAVSIDHDVWIGDDVRIKSGVHIGTGAVIAAGSIVTKNVSPYEIVAGVPAKKIRFRFDQSLRQDLLATNWWQYSPQDLLRFNQENPEAFAKEFLKTGASLQPLPEIRLRARQHLRRP